jgi:predicted secreted Zn-dependent protease
MKSPLLIAAFIFPFLLLVQRDDDYIKWQEDRKLTWEDFKAEPVKMGSTAAMTTTHLGFGYSVMNGQVTYKIDCRFEKKKSWGLVKNDWILKHEQGHFDIAELFARKLNQQTSEYKFDKNTFKSDLDAIYKSVVDEKEKYQQQYDDETNYSRNKNKQEEWLKKIEKELKETKDWTGYQ